MSSKNFTDFIDPLITGGLMVLLPAAIAHEVVARDFGFWFTLDVNLYLVSIGKMVYWLVKNR